MAQFQALRSNLRRIRRAGVAACVSVLAFGASLALAQGKQPFDLASLSCPAGYEIVRLQPAYCTNNAGDVVEPIAAYRPAAGAACPRGYEALWWACFNPKSGDVMLPEPQSRE